MPSSPQSNVASQTNKPVRFDKRSVLILLLAAAQLICLILGLFLFVGSLRSSLTQTLRTQVLNDNEQIASQLSLLIEQLDPNDLTKNSPDWERLQSVVERISLPNEGFMCVIQSETGELLCHPEIRSKPNMGSPARALLHTDEEAQEILQAVGTGWATMPDGNHLIAVKALPKFKIRILAHQRESGIATAIDQITEPIVGIGTILSIFITCLTACVAIAVIGRYENRLANINEHLEVLVSKRTASLLKTRNASVFGLAKLAESRDTDTGEHLERIRRFVVILAKRLQTIEPQVTDEFVETLALASSLHDIGKVGIPDRVLLKPGRLDPAERQEMEKHAQIGADCIAAIMDQLEDDDFLSMAHEVAIGHHEKFDGTGYPNGVKGTDIPLSARIAALADVYDALISPRVYKQPMSHAKARKIIVEGAGKHFDPAVTAAFMASESEFAAIAEDLHRRLPTENIAEREESDNSEKAPTVAIVAPVAGVPINQSTGIS